MPKAVVGKMALVGSPVLAFIRTELLPKKSLGSHEVEEPNLRFMIVTTDARGIRHRKRGLQFTNALRRYSEDFVSTSLSQPR